MHDGSQPSAATSLQSSSHHAPAGETQSAEHTVMHFDAKTNIHASLTAVGNDV